MDRYSVVVEVRSPGAIGVFWWHGITVDAEGWDDAARNAVTAFHAKGWETRGVHAINKLSLAPLSTETGNGVRAGEGEQVDG